MTDFLYTLQVGCVYVSVLPCWDIWHMKIHLCRQFKQQSSSKSLRKSAVMSFLLSWTQQCKNGWLHCCKLYITLKCLPQLGVPGTFPAPWAPLHTGGCFWSVQPHPYLYTTAPSHTSGMTCLHPAPSGRVMLGEFRCKYKSHSGQNVIKHWLTM